MYILVWQIVFFKRDCSIYDLTYSSRILSLPDEEVESMTLPLDLG